MESQKRLRSPSHEAEFYHHHYQQKNRGVKDRNQKEQKNRGGKAKFEPLQKSLNRFQTFFCEDQKLWGVKCRICASIYAFTTTVFSYRCWFLFQIIPQSAFRDPNRCNKNMNLLLLCTSKLKCYSQVDFQCRLRLHSSVTSLLYLLLLINNCSHKYECLLSFIVKMDKQRLVPCPTYNFKHLPQKLTWEWSLDRIPLFLCHYSLKVLIVNSLQCIRWSLHVPHKPLWNRPSSVRSNRRKARQTASHFRSLILLIHCCR